MTKEIVNRYKKVFTTDVSDELDELGIDGMVIGLPSIYQGAVLCGPAVTLRQVKAKARGLKLNKILEIIEDVAKPGDVIVIDAHGGGQLASWGGTMSLRSKARGIEGVVCDGFIRDIDVIREAKFPVFCQGPTPRTGTPYFETVDINQPVQIGGKVVKPGDLIYADGDGITIVPSDKVEEILDRAEKRKDRVAHGRELVKAGKSPFK